MNGLDRPPEVVSHPLRISFDIPGSLPRFRSLFVRIFKIAPWSFDDQLHLHRLIMARLLSSGLPTRNAAVFGA